MNDHGGRSRQFSDDQLFPLISHQSPTLMVIAWRDLSPQRSRAAGLLTPGQFRASAARRLSLLRSRPSGYTASTAMDARRQRAGGSWHARTARCRVPTFRGFAALEITERRGSPMMLRQSPRLELRSQPRPRRTMHWEVPIYGALATLLVGLIPVRGDGLSALNSEPEPLARKVEAVVQSPGYRSGHWGILVVDARTGRTIYEQNSDQLFAPASVTKLFSTAAALVELGSDYRFETPVVRRGEIDAQGTLHGDLILIAQGDLSMGGRTGADGSLLFKDDDHTYAGGNPRSDIVQADPLAGLDHLSREVRAAGIKHVTGEVIIDDRLFESAESTGSGPRRLSPIMINDNVVDVLVQPAKAAGEPASVSLVPATQYLTMDAQVETVAPRPEPSSRGPCSRASTVHRSRQDPRRPSPAGLDSRG